MNPMRRLILAASQNQWMRQHAPRFGFMRRASARFLPGEDVQDAVTAARSLAANGIQSVLSHLGENIADLGGVTLALDAYRASLQGQPSPLLDGLTGEQRVFLGWAQAWRGKNMPDAIKRAVASDPHSPRQFRVNGVVRVP